MGVLHSVATDGASELVHLTLELLVVADNVGGELAVDLHLGLLALGNGSIQLACLLGQHVCGVGAVLLHGGAHLIELGGVVVSHGLKLVILLQVLLVTLVTDLDHAVHLSVHVGVNLGLLSELGSQLAAALGSLGTGVGNLLVELVHGGLKGLAGSLGVLLDLRGIHSDVLVGLGNASIDCGLVSCHGTLLGLHGNAELGRGVGLVTSNTSTDELGTTDVCPVTPVGKRSGPVEAVLHIAHGTCKVILGLLGIHSHLVQESCLELLAGSLVECKVAVHLGAHSSDIALACSLLSSDIFLNVGEVICEAHAAVWCVGEDGACLLHIGGVHRGWATDPVHTLCRGEPLDLL